MPKFNEETDEIEGSKAVTRKKFTADAQAAMTRDDRDAARRKELAMAPKGTDEITGVEYIQGRTFVPQCHVCQHPFRDWIEAMLVKGFTYKGLQDRVPPAEGQNKLDRRSISNHHRNHMDLRDAAMVAIIEREANLQSIDREDGIGDIVTKRGVLEVMLRKGYEDILNNTTTVEPRDLIQLTKLLAEMDTHSGQVGLDEARAQVQLFIQAIKDVCDLDTQAAIAAQVKKLRGRENIDTNFEEMVAPVPALVTGTVEDLEPPEATIID